MIETADAAHFGLIVARVAAMAAMLPNVANAFSIRLRLGLAFAVSLMMTPLVAATSNELFQECSWLELGIEQLFWGAVLGGTIRVWVSSFAVAGAWISQIAGWGATELADDGQELAPAIGQLHGWLGGLTFLLMDGPRMVIQALLDSFTAIPVTAVLGKSTDVADFVATTLTQSLWLSLRIGSPVLVSIVASSIALAAIQRALPHIQMIRFQIAGNWLVLLLATSLTIGLNADHWRQSLSSLMRTLSPRWMDLNRPSASPSAEYDSAIGRDQEGGPIDPRQIAPSNERAAGVKLDPSREGRGGWA